MEILLDRMRREAARQQDNVGKTKLGTVTSYDPNNFAVKVMLQPEGIETGWMPVASPLVGNGWGMFLPPSSGDQVIVSFQENGHEVPLATLRLYDDKNRPLIVPSGEMWLVHETGSYLKLTNDGKVSFNASAEIDAGNLSNAVLTLATSAIMSIYNGHTHEVIAVGSQTAPVQSSQQMTTADFTTVLKAN
jgi:uncharacterized protein involved in type VI secretion and phage assembly